MVLEVGLFDVSAMSDLPPHHHGGRNLTPGLATKQGSGRHSPPSDLIRLNGSKPNPDHRPSRAEWAGPT